MRNCYLFSNKETEPICIDLALANDLCIIFNGNVICAIDYCNMVFMRQYEGDTVFLVLGNAFNYYAVTTDDTVTEGCFGGKE